MSSESGSFHVAYSTALKQEIKDILSKAKQVGELEGYARALLEIDDRMRTDPFGLGELKGRLAKLKLDVHVACVRPLVVEFAIDAQRKLVFVKRVESLVNL